MKEKKTWTKWFYWFTFAVAIIIVYKTLDKFTEIGTWLSNFLHVIMPFVIGIILAYILYIPTRKMESFFRKFKKLKFISERARGLAVILVYIFVVLILLLVMNYIVPIIISSVIDFVNHFQDYYNIVMKNINDLPDDSVLKSDMITNIVSQVGQIDISKYVNVEKLTEYA